MDYQQCFRLDIIHTKNEFSIFASISDTTLIIKDIPPNYSPQNRQYTIREDTLYFPHLGKFKVFKISNEYYVLNDIGEFYHVQESMPKLIGNIIFNDQTEVFYLIDNDSGSVSFNCEFKPLFPEYKNLVGYIDDQHWLSRRYFEIKEKYVKKLHELNKKTWK